MTRDRATFRRCKDVTKKEDRMPSDAVIRKAVEADIRQWMIDSVTPDRGYQTPIDNVRELIARLSNDAALARQAERKGSGA
jgi:hypothetical protein